MAVGRSCKLRPQMDRISIGKNTMLPKDDKRILRTIIELYVGQSLPIRMPFRLERVSVTDPEVVDIQTLSVDEVLLVAKKTGSTGEQNLGFFKFHSRFLSSNG